MLCGLPLKLTVEYHLGSNGSWLGHCLCHGSELVGDAILPQADASGLLEEREKGRRIRNGVTGMRHWKRREQDRGLGMELLE